MTQTTVNANLKNDFEKMEEAGDFMFTNEEVPANILFICPCGCGMLRHVPLKPIAVSPAWEWNGNKLKPSVTPSVNCQTGCRWHGWLTDGVFISS